MPAWLSWWHQLLREFFGVWWQTWIVQLNHVTIAEFEFANLFAPVFDKQAIRSECAQSSRGEKNPKHSAVFRVFLLLPGYRAQLVQLQSLMTRNPYVP